MRFIQKLLWVWLLFPSVAMAQKFDIGAGIGGLNYKGDVSPRFHPAFVRLGGNIYARYNYSRSVSFRADAMVGSIYAADKDIPDPFQQVRDYSFTTKISDVSLRAEYNFYTFKIDRKHINWSPYLFAGIGTMSFSPAPNNGNFKTSGIVLPFGIGLKYQFKQPWSIGLEFGTRKTFTDYLDNLGDAPTLANKLLQGTPATNDMYYYTSVSVCYTFYKIFCPDK